MDLNDFWQENKRFVLTVGAGMLVFFIGLLVVGSVYGDEVKGLSRQISSNNQKLKEPRHNAADLRVAQEENEALVAAVDTLSAAVRFEPRDSFQFVSGAGSASNQYFARVEDVREELSRLASRQRMRLPDGLGLEVLKTSREETVVRHLEALDLIDRVIRMGLEAGIDRIEKIQVKLDPSLGSRNGPGRIEQTEVAFQIRSSPQPVVQLLALSQSDRFGKPLTIGEVDVVGARSKDDEVRADLKFLVVRLHERDVVEEEQ